jgi:hypothetical protein
MYELTSRLEFRDVGNDTLVYDASQQKVHVVNATAAEILQNCSGRATSEIVSILHQRFDVGDRDVELDVQNVLDDFIQQGLVREVPA